MARYLCEKLGKDRFEVVPHVSSMQLAFARVKESWEEAYLTNLANQPLDQVVEKIRMADKAGLFTTESIRPRPWPGAAGPQDRLFFAYVCENLGSPDERVTQGELAEIAGQEFSPLNVMVLVRKPSMPDRPSEAIGRRLFGNPDEVFLQSKPKKGLLTPGGSALASRWREMDLGLEHGLGYRRRQRVGGDRGGADRRRGTIYAIEMDPEDHELITANAEQFGVAQFGGHSGPGSRCLAKLPDPEAMFVGGSGREIGRMVELAYERLRPRRRLVANVAASKTLAACTQRSSGVADDVKVWMINIARGTHQLERVRFEARTRRFSWQW